MGTSPSLVQWFKRSSIAVAAVHITAVIWAQELPYTAGMGIKKKSVLRSSFVAQQVKDLALLKLRHGFDSRPRNFRKRWMRQKKKQKKTKNKKTIS